MSVDRRLTNQYNEGIAGQPHLPVDDRKPIETYHQLIQQHKRLICCMIGLRWLPKYQQGPQCLSSRSCSHVGPNPTCHLLRWFAWSLKQHVRLLENSNIPRNIDILWNIGRILGDSPEYWGESRKTHRNSMENCRKNLKLNTLGIFRQIFHGIWPRILYWGLMRINNALILMEFHSM